MRNSYFKILLPSFMISAFLCILIRSVLYLFYIDYATGFYTHTGPAASFFNLFMFVSIAGAFIYTIAHNSQNEYPLAFRSAGSGIFSVICGILILACTIADSLAVYDRIYYSIIPRMPFSNYLFMTPPSWRFTWVFLVLKILLGILAACSMVMFGLIPRPGKLKFVGIFPALWQAVIMLERFTLYNAPLYISHNMLEIMFMVFAQIFLIGQARTICGYKLKDSRNYLIPSGLSTAFVGLAIVIPELIVPLVSGEFIFTSIWQLIFHIYELGLSLYAIIYICGFVKAIKKV